MSAREPMRTGQLNCAQIAWLFEASGCPPLPTLLTFARSSSTAAFASASAASSTFPSAGSLLSDPASSLAKSISSSPSPSSLPALAAGPVARTFVERLRVCVTLMGLREVEAAGKEGI